MTNRSLGFFSWVQCKYVFICMEELLHFIGWKSIVALATVGKHVWEDRREWSGNRQTDGQEELLCIAAQ